MKASNKYVRTAFGLSENILPFCVFVLMAFYFVPNLMVIPAAASAVYIILILMNRYLVKSLQSKWPFLALSAMYLTYYIVKVIGNIQIGVTETFVAYSIIFILSIMSMDR